LNRLQSFIFNLVIILHSFIGYKKDFMKKDKGIICLCGNDGTGKSTLVKLIKELYPGYIPLERSATHLDADL